MVLGTPNTCDGKALVPYASKVPTFRMKSKGAVDQGKIRRDLMVLVVDKLMKCQQYIPSIHAILYSADYPTVPEGSLQSSCEWSGPYTSVGKIGSGWMAHFLQKRYPDVFTSAVVEKIDREDDEAIKFLFCFDLQLSPGCPMPKNINDDVALTTAIFEEFSDSNGGRCGKLHKRVSLSTGVVDFKSGGCYRFTWVEDRASQIDHISGAEVQIPPHITINRGYSLIDNWSDSMARVELAPACHYLWEFFAGEPFVTTFKKDPKGAKKLSVMAQNAKAVEEKRATEVREARQGAKLLDKTKAARKVEVTNKARMAMDQKRQDRGQKRKRLLVS